MLQKAIAKTNTPILASKTTILISEQALKQLLLSPKQDIFAEKTRSIYEDRNDIKQVASVMISLNRVSFISITQVFLFGH